MPIKMIVTDLDGTLLRSDKSISDYTKRVLERCRARGILIAFATARSEISSVRFSREFMPDIFISQGGALARRGSETLWQVVIPPDIASALIRRCMEDTGVLQFGLETGDKYLSTTLFDPSDFGYEHAEEIDFTQLADYNDVCKVSIKASGRQVAQAIADDFPALNFISFRDEDWHTFRAAGATKENALAAVADALEIGADEIAAFGDDMSDIDMLIYAGNGVAMGNAIDEVKAAADFICNSNDEDGVARWLEERVESLL